MIPFADIYVDHDGSLNAIVNSPAGSFHVETGESWGDDGRGYAIRTHTHYRAEGIDWPILGWGYWARHMEQIG